jgi:hypothetical protein
LVTETSTPLLTGRAQSLLLKAFLVNVLYLLADRLATPENVWQKIAKGSKISD